MNETDRAQSEKAQYERRADIIRTVDAFPGVTRRTLGPGDHLTLVEIGITEGHEVPEHVHPHEQAGSVREGRVRFTIGGVVSDLEAGDAYLIPAASCTTSSPSHLRSSSRRSRHRARTSSVISSSPLPTLESRR